MGIFLSYSLLRRNFTREPVVVISNMQYVPSYGNLFIHDNII